MEIKDRFKNLKFNSGQPIGGYNVTFHERSKYIYKTLKTCEGFFIRKSYWLRLLNESSPDITDSFRENIRFHYRRLEDKIDGHRNSHIKKLSLRKDIKQFKFVSRVDTKTNRLKVENSMSMTSSDSLLNAMTSSTQALNRVKDDLLISIFDRCDYLISENKSMRLETENQKLSLMSLESQLALKNQEIERLKRQLDQAGNNPKIS